MCRLMAYIGNPMCAADVVLWPDRSIIKQSYDARERLQDPSLPYHLGFGNLNGDGFGIGWFPSEDQRERDATPCVFTSITPAWNNENLARLSRKIISPVIFAHVRAAYPGMPVSEQNCHPFQWGRYLWMHNGVMGGFGTIRRALLAQLSDAAYNTIQSFHSDSAVSFAVFLHHLPDISAPQPPDVMLQAMQDCLATIRKVQDDHGITATSLLNYVVSDGSTLIATRYVWPETEKPASLYYAEGASFVRGNPFSQAQDCMAGQMPPTDKPRTGVSCAAGSSVLQQDSYRLTYGGRGALVAFVASEPITGEAADWVSVPRNTAVVITREKQGLLNILRSPLTPGHTSALQVEVSRCLEAIGRGLSAAARSWVVRRTLMSPRSAFSEGATSTGAGREESLSGRLAPETYTVEDEDQRLTGHQGPVIELVKDPDRPHLFTSSTDCTVKVWDLVTLQCLHTLTHRKPVIRMKIHGNFLYTISAGIIHIWSRDDYECVHRVCTSLYSGALRCLEVSQEGDIYVGSQDTSVKLYRIPTLGARDPQSPTGEDKEVHAKMLEPDAITAAGTGHVGPVNALVVCGSYLCSAGGDGMIRVWNKEDLGLVRVLRGHRGSVLCLLNVGGLLLSGARDNLIRVWDMDLDMICRRTLVGHKDDVTHLAMMELKGSAVPMDQCLGCGNLHHMALEGLVASASADGTVRLWSPSWTCIRIFSASLPSTNSWPGSPPPTPRVTPASSPVLSVVMTSQHLVAGYGDNCVRFWNTEDVFNDLLMILLNGGESLSISRGNSLFSGHPFRLSGGGSLMSLFGDESTPELDVNEAHKADGLQLAGMSSTVSADVLSRFDSLDRSLLDASLRTSPSPQPLLLTKALVVPDIELIRALREFVNIKSVSNAKKLRDECLKGAKFVARMLESLGAEVKTATVQDDKNPVVFGRLGHNPNCPTITFYGHYDVQPAQEPDWLTRPFELASVDGYLYGRGTSDNKGPILAFIYAVKEMLDKFRALGQSLPVNVAFIFEGEEENGSVGFKEALQQNLRWVEDTQLVVISNTLWVGENIPCLTYGMRGMITLSVQVSGPARDLHSGNDGGVFNEPMSDLVKVLGTLVDTDNEILVEGFYDQVRPHLMDLAWTSLRESQEFSMEGYKDILGVPTLTAPPEKQELLNVRWCRPSLSVVDVRVTEAEGPVDTSCYKFGPTRFSVIPKTAVGKVSIRFVPAQSADELICRLIHHLEVEFKKLGSRNRLNVVVHSVGDWWEADPDSRFFKAAEAALKREWSVDPLYVREGGTMPVASLIEKILHAPVVMIPLGQSSDNIHLANERLRRLNLIRGRNVIRDLLEDLGTLQTPPDSS